MGDSNRAIADSGVAGRNKVKAIKRIAYVDSPFVNNINSQLKNKCVLMYEL